MIFLNARTLVLFAAGLSLAAFIACAKEDTPPHLVVTLPDSGAGGEDASQPLRPDTGSDAAEVLDASDDGNAVQKLAACKDLSNSVTYIQICKDLSTLTGRDIPNGVQCPEASRNQALLAGCVYDDTPPDAGDLDGAVPAVDAGRSGNLCCPPNVKGGML